MQDRIFNQCFVAQVVPEAFVNVHLMVPILGTKTKKENTLILLVAVYLIWDELSLVLSPSGHITLIKMSQMTRLTSLLNSWKTQLAFVLNWVRTSLGCHRHDTRSCMFWMDTVTDSIPTWFPVCARLNYWAIVCFVKSPHSIRNTRAETRCQSQSQHSSIMWHPQVFAARPASKRHSSLE